MTTKENRSISILIVEDEGLIRDDIAECAGDQGFVVYEAANAEEAIYVLESHSEIRLVFTDINMPGSMDGLKLAHYVRGRWPPVKIMITSGLIKVRQEDLPRGAIFVSKPYRAEDIALQFLALTADAA
jgi:two-component system, response regulator PdtaR